MKKKLISLTLAIVLVLALCMPIAARSLACPTCRGSMTQTSQTREIVDYVECPIDPDMRDPVYLITTTYKCSSCGDVVEQSRTESYCKH